MKHIIFEDEQGLNIVIPSPRYMADCMTDKQDENGNVIKGMTEAAFYAHIAEKDIPNGITGELIAPDTIPKDRTFRAAWKKGTKKIDIDMAKAQTIQMDRIRDVRNKKLAELDIETLKGVDVQKEKQVLRDIPQTFDLSAAKTPEELKNLWPEALK